MLNVPVLFLVFNRPDVTERVFDAIRAAKPSHLYVAQDGARSQREDDKKNCEEVRKVVKNVDWNCEVKYLFREKNLGCKIAVAEGIGWFFEHVEAGIILEDDCLPHADFFTYCSELLHRFRDDDRIGIISGHNPITNWHNGYSYFYSKIGAIWGWATWRRAWAYYDVELKLFKNAVEHDWLSNVLTNPAEKQHRIKVLTEVVTGANDTWDYQWTFARLINSGLSIIPANNMIQNIGFGENATHTTKHDAMFVNQPVFPFPQPIQHPPFIFPDIRFDRQRFDTVTQPVKHTVANNGGRKKKIKEFIKKVFYGR